MFANGLEDLGSIPGCILPKTLKMVLDTIYLPKTLKMVLDTSLLGSIPGCILPKTLKMVLDTSLLNTQQYKVHIEGKVKQSRKRSRCRLVGRYHTPNTEASQKEINFWQGE